MLSKTERSAPVSMCLYVSV